MVVIWPAKGIGFSRSTKVDPDVRRLLLSCGMRQIAIRRLVLALGLAVLLLTPVCGRGAKAPATPLSPPDAVGRVAPNRYQTATGQVLTPLGTQVELPGMRPQALALSPDGAVLAAAGRRDALVLIEPNRGMIFQTVPLSFSKIELKAEPKADLLTDPAALIADNDTTNAAPASKTNKLSAEMSFNGLAFSPDGRRLYVSNAGGNLWAFPIGWDHKAGEPIVIPVQGTNASRVKHEIPTGLAVSRDGQRLYVAGNLGNRLYEMEAESGKLLRWWETGVAPYEVVLAGQKAYVSNLGGRRPGRGDLTAPAGSNTKVRVDSKRHIASEGSVTVIDLARGKVKTEILVELHASALAVTPNGKYVVVANTGSDTLSVIDTGTDRVVEKIWTRQTPADLFGAQPNALTFDPSGKRLYVCNGTQNAVAVVQFEPEDKASKLMGLIPVGWFPGAIQTEASGKMLYVANIKGIGSSKAIKPGEKTKLNAKDFLGTVSLLPIPSDKKLIATTRLALQNLRYQRLAEARLPARADQPARPVPERVGEPSPLKHVIYVIKENRTYDQVLGDLTEGNGDAELCTFGELYTPNQHKIAREFILLDNIYCSGVCSADGHQWTDSAMANEYVERQLSSGTPRSYTGAKAEDAVDALAWASSGFIWDNALAHGVTFRNYGEWMLSRANWRDKSRKGKVQWHDFWGDFMTNSGTTQLRSKPLIETLRQYSPTNTVGWDLKVPDVRRAAEFIRELNQFEEKGGFPQLMIVYLPNDHTGGTRNDYPTPGAQIADNDLALGRIVDAVSHSRFWPETCLFAIEDDPQAGWDHVSGYRTTGYVVSPYTKRRQTIGTQYNQISIVRTLELILGLPPMNQMDATATPMFDCFMETADLTPYNSVTNRVPLEQMNPEPKKVTDRRLRQDALASNRLPLEEPDKCPEDFFNRILWRAMKGSGTPYPEWAVKAGVDND